MKIIKPQSLTLLTRAFELSDRFMLSLTAIVCVDWNDARRFSHESALYLLAGELLGEAPLDEAMIKSRAEVIVLGSACAKEGTEATVVPVRIGLLRNGKALFTKSLMVFGDRTWDRTGMSAPTPFAEMPITWARAFGGENFDNAVGRGVTPDPETKKVSLPNVEDPAHLIHGPSDRPAAVSLGPLSLTRKDRMKCAGTYDDKWLSQLYPAPPADFHWEFHNVAPIDQRLPDFFNGTETLTVEGMHPTCRLQEFKLPPLSVRLFLLRKSKVEAFEPEILSTRLDTVIAFPTAGKVALVYRASVAVDSDDAFDVAALMGAVEADGQDKGAAHYLAAMKRRMNPEQAAHSLIADHELMPPGTHDALTAIGEAFGDAARAMTPDGHALAYVLRKVEANIESMRTDLIARGQSTEAFDLEVEKVQKKQAALDPKKLSLDALTSAVHEELANAERERETKVAEAEAEVRAEFAKFGKNFDEMKAEKRRSGPPDVLVEVIVSRLRELATLLSNAGQSPANLQARLEDPNFLRELHKTETELLRVYRSSAHLFGVVDEARKLEARERGLELLRRAKEGVTIANFDATYADLTDLDFSGLDLSDALLECAFGQNVRFDGARLDRAVLARATLSKSSFRGASLAGTNFAKGQFTDTEFSSADLINAVLVKGDFERSDFRGAKLGGMFLTEASFIDVSFESTTFESAISTECRFERCSFKGAKMSGILLTSATLSAVTFEGARLDKAIMFRCKGEGVSFAGALLTETKLTDSVLPAADFTGAALCRTLLRGVELVGATFRDAVARDCDFSQANLTSADLGSVPLERTLMVRTILDGANLSQANLMYACLQKAHISRTNFRGANCFRADFARAVGDDKTDFSGAYIKETRMTRNEPKKTSASLSLEPKS